MRSNKVRALLIIALALLAFAILTPPRPDPAKQEAAEATRRCQNVMNQIISQGPSKSDEEKQARRRALADGCAEVLLGPGAQYQTNAIIRASPAIPSNPK
jgi:uncharacterized membrane protein YccC